MTTILATIATAILPEPAAKALVIAQESTAALHAARAALDAGRGPIAALRAFAAATDGALDDAAVAQLEAWLAQGVTALDAACAGAAWLAEHEPQYRAGVEATLAATFGAAYQLAAWRHRVRGWMAD